LRNYFVSPAAGDGVPVNAADSPYTLALSSGTLLAGRFRIDGPVSSASAFAITYNAKDLTTGNMVVVKEFFPRSLVSRTEGGVVRPHSAEDERDFLRALRRFALEGAALAEASHPNLVRVRRVIEANETVYLVMDHHQSQPLTEFVGAAGGRLPAAQAGRLVQQLLSALEPLHGESIIHRDLSPRSLHVSAEGNALLLGFSARRHLAIHATDLMPGYAAFEQYGTKDVGPWTDVYAASAILYYLLTGNTPPSALDRAAGEALVPPGSAVQGLSSGLTRLVLRGMALLPQQRPHAASEMRRQLETALAENTSVSGAPSANPNSLGFDASLLASIAGEDADRGSTLRLAEGGIVVPGSEPSTPWFLRKLGTALRRSPVEQDLGFDSLPVERPTAAPAVLREPSPSFAAAYAPPPVAPAPVVPAPVVPAPLVEAPAPVAHKEPAAPVAVRETPGVGASVSLLDAASLPAKPRRQMQIADEIALATAEMQFGLSQQQQRRRYSLVAAAVLVVGVGSSLLLLTKKGSASGERVTAGTAGEVGTPASAIAPRSVPAPMHNPAESGAVQQSKAALTRTSTAATESASAANSASSTKANAAAVVKTAPATNSPAPVLPSGTRLPNLNVAVNAGADLKMLPPEMLVDARTRMSNGEDLVEQGDYQLARRTFHAALTQLDSISARYPESQSIRALRRDIEQADSRAVQACGAENEMRKRRGEALRACQ
jgi:serine/threonine protein kinase